MTSIPILVAYHSLVWIRGAVESYLEHFPEDRFLVVDNNPKRGEPGWLPDCERERVWLATHPNVLLLDNAGPGDLASGHRSHGGGVDLAVGWCRGHGIDVMLHLEPDCLVTGREWRDNLLRAVEQGAWMAGGLRQIHGAIHPMPSAWLVREVRVSFKTGPWAGPDEQHPRFRELVDLEALDRDRTRTDEWIRHTRNWDTGHKAWFEAAVHDRTALVPVPGLRHFWHGSWIRRFSEETLCAQFPELRPYLERARLRDRVRPVEACPFREPAPGGARCRLIREASGATDPAWGAVPEGACAACCRSFPPSPGAPNPVVASLLYGLAERIIDKGGVPGCSAAAAAALREWAEPSLDLESR